MGYRLVAVNPLIPFPLPKFGVTGLADVASLDDATKQIKDQFKEAAQLRIDAEEARIKIDGGQLLATDVEKIRADYEKTASEQIERLNERWGKIEPALKLHLARQGRRKKHFSGSCRFAGCDNPKPEAVKVIGGNTKSRRPGAKPLFCRSHRWVQGMISKENIRSLQADEKNRVVIK